MSKNLRKKLRTEPSPAEVRFWRLIFPLRTAGWHFRKQHQIGEYYVDFACPHAKLVVEIDGDTHGTEEARQRDAARDRYLAERGFTVLRYSNDDVLTNPYGVYDTLMAALAGRPHNHRSPPPPQPDGDRGQDSSQTGFDTLPLAGRVGEGVPLATDKLDGHSSAVAERTKPGLGHLRVVLSATAYIGPGRADLLEGIARTGSIAAAGKAMGMSYKRAWSLVQALNDSFAQPLVETARGGVAQGGALLTPLGQEVLARYRAMQKATEMAILADVEALKRHLPDIPS